MKKIVALLLALVVVFSMSTSAFAVEKAESFVVEDSVITDPEEIQRIQQKEAIEVPDGYHIEEIRYTTVLLNGDVPRQPQTRGIFDKWEVKNVSKDSNEYYFPDSPLTSDWIDGPSSYTETFEYTVEATYSSNTSVSSDVIEAGVGFSVTEGSSFSKSYNISVPEGKKMNLKVYGNYFRYSFEVYKDDVYQGNGKAYKPIGLTFKQVLYAQ